MTDTTATDRQLPYGGTVAELRQMVAGHAQRDEVTFGRLLDAASSSSASDIPEGAGERDLKALQGAHHGALYGWSLVAILRWLGEEYGPEAAYRAAAMVQDLGENGGNDWVDDIPPLAEGDARPGFARSEALSDAIRDAEADRTIQPVRESE